MNDREKIQFIQRKSLLLFKDHKILYENDDYITILLNFIEIMKSNKDNNQYIIDKLYEMHNCIQTYILLNEILVIK